jgi:hypothetical protein
MRHMTKECVLDSASIFRCKKYVGKPLGYFDKPRTDTRSSLDLLPDTTKYGGRVLSEDKSSNANISCSFFVAGFFLSIVFFPFFQNDSKIKIREKKKLVYPQRINRRFF